MNEIQFAKEIGRLLDKNHAVDSVATAVSIACAHYKLPSARYKILYGLLVGSRDYSNGKNAFSEKQFSHYRLLSILKNFPKFDIRFELNNLVKEGYVNKGLRKGSRVYSLSSTFYESIK